MPISWLVFMYVSRSQGITCHEDASMLSLIIGIYTHKFRMFLFPFSSPIAPLLRTAGLILYPQFIDAFINTGYIALLKGFQLFIVFEGKKLCLKPDSERSWDMELGILNSSPHPDIS